MGTVPKSEMSQKNTSFDGRERSATQQAKRLQQNNAYHSRQKSENISNPSASNHQMNERVIKSNTRARLNQEKKEKLAQKQKAKNKRTKSS